MSTNVAKRGLETTAGSSLNFVATSGITPPKIVAHKTCRAKEREITNAIPVKENSSV